jgi:hypothetical protein
MHSCRCCVAIERKSQAPEVLAHAKMQKLFAGVGDVGGRGRGRGGDVAWKDGMVVSCSGWIYVKTVYDWTGWMEQATSNVHHHQSPLAWMFKRVAGETMPRGFYKDGPNQPEFFGAEGNVEGEGVQFLHSMPAGRPAEAPRLMNEELDAVRSGVNAVRSLCSKAERAQHRWIDIQVAIDPDLRPGEIGQRGVLEFEGKQLEIRVLDDLPEDLWERSMPIAPSVECKNEDLVLPHAIVSNISSSRGRSTRGKAGRAMLGRRATEASDRRRARQARRAGAKRSRSSRRKDAEEDSEEPSESAAFSPSEPSADSQRTTDDSDYDPRDNTIEARMPSGQAVSQGDVGKSSRVMVFFELPHGWCAGSVRGPCKTNPECNFDVVYRERDGRTRVYPQMLDEDRRGQPTPGGWVLLERARK